GGGGGGGAGGGARGGGGAGGGGVVGGGGWGGGCGGAAGNGGDGVKARGSAVRVLVLLSMVAATVVGLAVPAQATFHFVRVRQVFAGLPGHHDVQYIELQSFQVCCQNMFEGHHVDVFDAAGKRVGSFAFSQPVA